MTPERLQELLNLIAYSPGKPRKEAWLEVTNALRATNPEAERYEYGVGYRVGDDVVMHRTGFTLDQATNWVSSWDRENTRPNRYCVARRSVGEWEEAPNRARV